MSSDYELGDLPYNLVALITVDFETGCWNVGRIRPAGDTPNPYRSVTYCGKRWQAHVLAYVLLVGEYDRRLVLDHVYARGCRSKACCNPRHLEPVTDSENQRRRRETESNKASITR